jgi:hypothetical protein
VNSLFSISSFLKFSLDWISSAYPDALKNNSVRIPPEFRQNSASAEAYVPQSSQASPPPNFPNNISGFTPLKVRSQISSFLKFENKDQSQVFSSFRWISI